MPYFKYMSADHWETSILDGLIRFSQPCVFNDPFELQPHYIGAMPDDQLRQTLKSSLEEILPEEIEKKLASLPPDIREGQTPTDIMNLIPPSLFDVWLDHGSILMNMMVPFVQNKLVETFSERVGILCLSEHDDSLLMWAHYANSHAGMVLEFDETHPFFNQRRGDSDEFGYLRRVAYSKERPSLHMIDSDATVAFLTKSGDWSYESEWRMLLPLQNATRVLPNTNPPVHLFSIPKKALRRIVFGCRMSPERVQEISSVIQELDGFQHLRLEQASLHPRNYELQFSALCLPKYR